MSIVIHGIDIPEDCSTCPCLKPFGCGAANKQIPWDFITWGRPNWCPVEQIDDDRVELNVFNEIEVHENCTVEILRNSITKQISIGWKENGSNIQNYN